MSGQASPLTTDPAVDVFDGVRSVIREAAAVLEVAPEQLDRIEFWCVARKPDDVKAPMGRQPRAVGFDAPQIRSLRRARQEPRSYDTPDVADVAMGQPHTTSRVGP